MSFSPECRDLLKRRHSLEELVRERTGTDDFVVHHAIQEEDVEKVREVLAKFPDKINQTNLLGQTPLHLATVEGHADIVYLLLNEGAAVNMRNSLGKTALMRAVDRDRQNIARLLIEYGADVSITTEHGDSAYSLAVKANNRAFMDLLIPHLDEEEAQSPPKLTAPLQVVAERHSGPPVTEDGFQGFDNSTNHSRGQRRRNEQRLSMELSEAEVQRLILDIETELKSKGGAGPDLGNGAPDADPALSTPGSAYNHGMSADPGTPVRKDNNPWEEEPEADPYENTPYVAPGSHRSGVYPGHIMTNFGDNGIVPLDANTPASIEVQNIWGSGADLDPNLRDRRLEERDREPEFTGFTNTQSTYSTEQYSRRADMEAQAAMEKADRAQAASGSPGTPKRALVRKSSSRSISLEPAEQSTPSDEPHGPRLTRGPDPVFLGEASPKSGVSAPRSEGGSGLTPEEIQDILREGEARLAELDDESDEEEIEQLVAVSPVASLQSMLDEASSAAALHSAPMPSLSRYDSGHMGPAALSPIPARASVSPASSGGAEPGLDRSGVIRTKSVSTLAGLGITVPPEPSPPLLAAPAPLADIPPKSPGRVRRKSGFARAAEAAEIQTILKVSPKDKPANAPSGDGPRKGGNAGRGGNHGSDADWSD